MSRSIVALVRSWALEETPRWHYCRYGAGSWDKEQRFLARIEAASKGLDVRF